MKIKKYKQFYTDNNLKVQFDAFGLPSLNGIDCMCDVAKCPNDYSCHDGTPCPKFKPNKRFYVWQEKGDKTAKKVDWDKDYTITKQKSDLEKKVEKLESRIAALESPNLIKFNK